MHRLLLAFPLALLTGLVQAGNDHRHLDDIPPHGESLAAHEHGSARLNLAAEGDALEIELISPAMNLIGFEHVARSEADRAKVAAVRIHLEQPIGLFGIPAAANCQVQAHSLHGTAFDPSGAKQAEHSEIEARYRLQCRTPEMLQDLNLAALFGTFPATQKIQVQLIGPHGQQGLELSPERTALQL